ncbi:hypothetical protein BDV18DRAFT_152267 [Aspergillus unguis]
MSTPTTLFTDTPPPARTPYAIPQLEGERLTIPGSKGTFRILASSKQTNGLMSVFQSGAVLSDAPGFHYHNQAHDVFLVTKGYLKLWNGGKCRIMGPGDFAYVPPGVIHNPEMLGPHTETFGVVTPGDWIDFFRYISEPYSGILVPEADDRDLKALLIPKVMAAKGQFDVVFQPNYVPPPVTEWDETDERLPDGPKPEPYFLRSNTGPRYMLGGVLVRPFITTRQSGGVVAIASVESSNVYGRASEVLSRFLAFEKVDHCLAVLEGTLAVKLKESTGEREEVFREGETVVIPAGQAFALEFRSKYVRVWSFTDGDGIEALVQKAGKAFDGVVLPESVGGSESEKVESVAQELNISILIVVNGSCHVQMSLLARSALALHRRATDAGPRSTNAMSCIRARIARKVNELNAKLQAAQSKLSSREGVHVGATPSSLPADKPALTPASTSRQETDPEVPASSYAGNQPESDGTEGADDEISEINHHTNGIEFHGSTSSVAFLGHLQKARDPREAEHGASLGTHWPRSRPEYSIVSTLHNSSFSPGTGASQAQLLASFHEHNYYFEQAHVFMSGYFENIHFIHPFIDKENFHLRAHDLWMRRNPTPDPTFVALYLSILSFGALLRVWDENQLGGLTRFEWSRKLFGEAQLFLNYLHFPNNLDAVQCLYLMAKICQNELNPNLAYMYLGLAVRTCLAAGFNRNVRHTGDPRADWISKTWCEMSFSLGRPDTLGLDDYHNRPLPPRDDSQYAIIPWMVDFARITRKVSVQIYHKRVNLEDKLAVALAIEAELDGWIARLPEWLRPDFVPAVGEEDYKPNVDGARKGSISGRNDLKDPKWARRQRLVLGIRYYNVKTLLFRPFLRHPTALGSHSRFGAGNRRRSHSLHTTTDTMNSEKETDADIEAKLSSTISKCLDAAQNTISVIHDIYRVHTFFRCWWYNTTYVTFATSTLLLPLSHGLSNPTSHISTYPKSPSSSNLPLQAQPGLGPSSGTEPDSITRSVEKAIEILEATDESVVTRKCAEIIRYYLREFQTRDRDRSREQDRFMRDGVPQGDGGWYAGGHVEPVDGYGYAGVNPGFGIGIGNGNGTGGEFDIPEWAYSFGFPECSFEGIARFFDDLGGMPILDE